MVRSALCFFLPDPWRSDLACKPILGVPCRGGSRGWPLENPNHRPNIKNSTTPFIMLGSSPRLPLTASPRSDLARKSITSKVGSGTGGVGGYWGDNSLIFICAGEPLDLLAQTKVIIISSTQRTPFKVYRDDTIQTQFVYVIKHNDWLDN